MPSPESTKAPRVLHVQPHYRSETRATVTISHAGQQVEVSIVRTADASITARLADSGQAWDDSERAVLLGIARQAWYEYLRSISA